MNIPAPLRFLVLDFSRNKGNWRGKIIVCLYRFSQLVRGTEPASTLIRKFLIFPLDFLQWIFGCEISPKAQIGPGLIIYHPFGIVIGPFCRIGSNFVIRQNCTVGQKNMLGDAPTIGDNVEMGAHSIILGAICVGNNVVIGANSMLISDAIDSGIYVGSPAKLIS